MVFGGVTGVTGVMPGGMVVFWFEELDVVEADAGGGVILALLPCILRLMVFALAICCLVAPAAINALSIRAANFLMFWNAANLALIALVAAML